MVVSISVLVSVTMVIPRFCVAVDVAVTVANTFDFIHVAKCASY